MRNQKLKDTETTAINQIFSESSIHFKGFVKYKTDFKINGTENQLEVKSQKSDSDKLCNTFLNNLLNHSPVDNLSSQLILEEPMNIATISKNLFSGDNNLLSLACLSNRASTKLPEFKKNRRGRPPVEYSVPPTLEQLKNAGPGYGKYLERRYKNNEASRVSRRKRHLYEEELKLEEHIETEKNRVLKKKHAKLTEKHEFLKEYLFPITKRR